MTGTAVTSIDNFQNAFTININAAGLRQEQNGFQIDDATVNEPSRGGGASISPFQTRFNRSTSTPTILMLRREEMPALQLVFTLCRERIPTMAL